MGKNFEPEGTDYDIYVNGQPSYSMKQVIDVDGNDYSNLFKSIESVFFWTGGRWNQLDQWNYWPIDVFSIIGSIFIVTILQNMLIAIMT
jgi:hypothetical protein